VRKLWWLLAAVLLVSPLTHGDTARGETDTGPEVRVGFVLDGPSHENDVLLSLFQGELTQLLQSEFDVRFPPDATLVADYSSGGVRAANDQLLGDPSVDLFVTLGALASVDACRRETLAKPVIAPFVIDAEAQRIPQADGTSGVENLSYLVSPHPFRRDLAALAEVVPFERLAILAPPSLFSIAPGVFPEPTEPRNEWDFAIEFIEASDTAEATLASIAEEVDAVYFLPLLHLDPAEHAELIEGLTERRLPSFSVRGQMEVEQGVLMGMTPASWWQRLARRVALNAQRILSGQDAGTLRVLITRDEELFINIATARAIGVHPRFDVLSEATLINDVRADVARTLSLRGAVEEALAANQELEAAGHSLAAAQEDVSLARAKLLPQVDAVGVETVIDEDRAEASLGSVAERTLTGELRLQQVIWSEPAWANLSIQNNLLRASEAEYERTRLDVSHAAAGAYLSLLQAKTAERVQRENLKLTRSNLERAEVRVSTGVASAAELYRWQSQLAADRTSVIEAGAVRSLAEMEVNRVCHRPLEESFATDEVALDDPAVIPVVRKVSPYIDNPWGLRVFRAFMVEQGLAASPELAQIDASIQAQERLKASARNAFFSPTLALTAGTSYTFAEEGAGSDVAFPKGPDDTDWNVSLSLSIPLFTGGSRFADARQANEELKQLRADREALAERIEQRIRSAIYNAGASRAALTLTRQSAEAARKNLDLVADAYARGVVSITELLDAQTASVNAEQAAANAVHVLLLDLMEVERATGSSFLFASEEELDAWLEQLDAFYQEAEGGRGEWR